jgi:hypothetical protein
LVIDTLINWSLGEADEREQVRQLAKQLAEKPGSKLWENQ